METHTGHIEKRLIQSLSRLDCLQLDQGERGRMHVCVEGVLAIVK